MVPAIIIPRKLFLLLASHSVIWTEIFPRCRRLAVDHKLLQSKRNIGWELEPADPVQTLPFLALPFKRMLSETCRNWSDPQKGLRSGGVSPLLGTPLTCGCRQLWEPLRPNSSASSGVRTDLLLGFHLTRDNTRHCVRVRWGSKCTVRVHQDLVATSIGNSSKLRAQQQLYHDSYEILLFDICTGGSFKVGKMRRRAWAAG